MSEPDWLKFINTNLEAEGLSIKILSETLKESIAEGKSIEEEFEGLKNYFLK